MSPAREVPFLPADVMDALDWRYDDRFPGVLTARSSCPDGRIHATIRHGFLGGDPTRPVWTTMVVLTGLRTTGGGTTCGSLELAKAAVAQEIRRITR